MKNIVILGGLGYIGTQLCKLYDQKQPSQEKYNILVIDNRFLPERVKQLKDWGIKYIQGDILDKRFMQKKLGDCNYIYHLAGITDVAYVKTEANSEQDNKIRITGTDGSRIVIDSIPSKCKILFPSTHVVFEGLKETTLDIKEDAQPCPVLTYATSKYDTEKDLAESDRNYVICRLGSNYGYGGDSMRLNILPNLFARMAAQNKIIKLFSGGIQLKPLVDVRDAARCFKFLMEKEDVRRQLFHIVKENVRVKEVGELCKEIKPKIRIIETDDEIPSEGYTLSSSKLLGMGFEFQYNLKDALKEMIDYWSYV